MREISINTEATIGTKLLNALAVIINNDVPNIPNKNEIFSSNNFFSFCCFTMEYSLDTKSMHSCSDTTLHIIIKQLQNMFENLI